MADTPPEKVPPEVGTQKLHSFYPLTPELAKELRTIEHMPAGAWRLWSFLATFDPFGSDYLELPELTDILAECNISKATFYRAIALFTEHDLFDLQPTKMFVLNLRGQKIVSKMRQVSQNCDSESQKREFQSQNCDSQSHSCESPKMDPALGASFSDGQCTNNRFKDFKEQQNSKDPPIPPCSEDIDREDIGTSESDPLTAEIEGLCTQIQEAGVRPNKTIQTTIATLLLNEGSAAAARLLRNAISALAEQQRNGTIRNPGGFLNAALRRNFTANQAKVEARVHRQKPQPQPPDLTQVSLAVDIALTQHSDRGFALSKLQQLWSEGWHDQLEELLQLRRDWGFSLTQGGVSDASS